MAYAERRKGVPPLEERLEDFLLNTGVDESAAEALRSEPREVVRAVLESGMRADVRNPSSLLISMIRQARQGVLEERKPAAGFTGSAERGGDRRSGGGDRGERGGGGIERGDRGGERGGGWRRAMEAFIVDHGLDERVQEALREASEEEVRRILDSGPISARNPSAVVTSMLRRSREGSQRGGGGERRPRLDLGTFIKESGLDSTAEDALCSQTDDVIQAILEDGVMKGYNTSAMVMRKIRDLSQGGAPRAAPQEARRPSPRRGRLDLRSFIRDYGIDANAEDFLRQQRQEIIDAVLEEGVHGARNPSAAVIARIRQLLGAEANGGSGADADWECLDCGANVFASKSCCFKCGAPRPRLGGGGFGERGGGYGDRGARSASRPAPAADYGAAARAAPRATDRRGALAAAIEEFLAGSPVDAKAEETFRSQSETVIRSILAEGPLIGRNSSALLVSRIRTHTAEPPPPADSAPPWGEAPWRNSRDAGQREIAREPQRESELQMYLRENNIDDPASEALQAQSVVVVRTILAEGPIRARNPSAVVMKRIRELTSEPTGGRAVEPEPAPRKRKSRMCRHFQLGKCNYGDACSFRHTPIDGAGDPTPGQEGGAEPMQGEAERELVDALEELHTAAWNFQMSQEDFEALLQRVGAARDAAVAAAEPPADAANGDVVEPDEEVAPSPVTGRPSGGPTGRPSAGSGEDEEEPAEPPVAEEAPEEAPEEDPDLEPPSKRMRPPPSAPRPSSAAGAA